jgi:hypothetical protein
MAPPIQLITREVALPYIANVRTDSRFRIDEIGGDEDRCFHLVFLEQREREDPIVEIAVVKSQHDRLGR